jgi:hypothetical protein
MTANWRWIIYRDSPRQDNPRQRDCHLAERGLKSTYRPEMHLAFCPSRQVIEVANIFSALRACHLTQNRNRSAGSGRSAQRGSRRGYRATERELVAAAGRAGQSPAVAAGWRWCRHRRTPASSRSGRPRGPVRGRRRGWLAPAAARRRRKARYRRWHRVSGMTRPGEVGRGMNGVIARRIVEPVEQGIAVPAQAVLGSRASKGGKQFDGLRSCHGSEQAGIAEF